MFSRKATLKAVLPACIPFALVFGAWAVLSSAEDDSISAKLKKGTAVGVAFNDIPQGFFDVNVTLNRPDGWSIVTNPQSSRLVSKEGDTIWNRTSADENTHVWEGCGVNGNCWPGALFAGNLFKHTSGGGGGGKHAAASPTFNAAVADIDIDVDSLGLHSDEPTSHHWPPIGSYEEDDMESGDGTGGLALPASLITGEFPSNLPSGTNYKLLTLTLNPKWVGGASPDGKVGTLTFSSAGSGFALYELTGGDSGTLVTSGIRVPPSGFSSKQYAILTNEDFTGPGGITSTFTWDSNLKGGADTATDHVRLMPYCARLDADTDNSVVIEHDSDEMELKNAPPGKYLTILDGCAAVEVTLDVGPVESLSGLTAKLWSPDNQAGLEVWAEATGGEPIQLPAVWDLSQGDPPSSLWVKAAQAGESQLRLSLCAGATELFGETVFFAALADTAANTAWDKWMEVKFVGKTPKEKVGGVEETETLTWRTTGLGDGVIGTPIPPNQDPANRFKKEGNYYRTKAANYTAFEMTIEWKIGDWNSAWPQPPPPKPPATHDCLQYYGNSGVYIYNQYEVQIIDVNNYSQPNGGTIEANGNNLAIVNAVKDQQWWKDKFEGKPTTIAQLLLDGITDAPVLATRSVPGGLYGQGATLKNFTKARDAEDRWNTLRIKFWPKDANHQNAYIMTWVNYDEQHENKVMDQEVLPTGTKWGADNIQTSGAIYLQSHWGSNVEFRNVNVQALTEQRP